MITINRHTLDNGLRIVHSEFKDTQMVAINVLYDVGHVMNILSIPVLPTCSNT